MTENNTVSNDSSTTAESGGEVKHLSYGTLIARRFFRQKSAVAGVVIFILLLLFALFGGKICKWSYDDPDFMSISEPPSAEHWLGTDPGGLDLFALISHGLGKSMLIGIITSVATMTIAALYGTAIAFFGGWIERVGRRRLGRGVLRRRGDLRGLFRCGRLLRGPVSAFRGFFC